MDRKCFRDSEMSDLQTRTVYCEQQRIYFKDISSNELKVIARVLIRSGMSCTSEKVSLDSNTFLFIHMHLI